MPVFSNIYGTDTIRDAITISDVSPPDASTTTIAAVLPTTATAQPVEKTVSQIATSSVIPVNIPPTTESSTPTVTSISSILTSVTSSTSSTVSTSSTSSVPSTTSATSSTSSSISTSVKSSSSKSVTTPPSISSPKSTPLSTKVSSSSPISTGVAIAIAAGGLAALAIFLVIFKFVRRRLKAEKDSINFDRSESHMILEDDYAAPAQPEMYESRSGGNSIYSNPEMTAGYAQQHSRDSFGNNGSPYTSSYVNNSQHASWDQPGVQARNPPNMAGNQIPHDNYQHNPYTDQQYVGNNQIPANYYNTSGYQQPPNHHNSSPNYGPARQTVQNPDDAYGGI